MFKNLILYLVFALFGNNTFAQGSVDIEYVSIDSINSSFLGKEIRIDFKSLDKSEADQPKIAKSALFGDTFSLEIKNKKTVFIEKWVFYIDEKRLKDQSFRSKNLHSDIQIHEMTIEHIDDTSITVKAAIYDVDSTYVELDKKRKILEDEMNKIENEITLREDQSAGVNPPITALLQKVRELRREIRKLDRQEQHIDFEWIKKNKKFSVERLIIKKSDVDGVLMKME